MHTCTSNIEPACKTYLIFLGAMLARSMERWGFEGFGGFGVRRERERGGVTFDLILLF